LLILLPLALTLAACGGSSVGPIAPNRTQLTPGLYLGTADTGSGIMLVFKRDGGFLGLSGASNPLANDSTILRGTGSSANGRFDAASFGISVQPGSSLPVTAGASLGGPITATTFQCTCTLGSGSVTIPLDLQANTFNPGSALQGGMLGTGILYDPALPAATSGLLAGIGLPQPLALTGTTAFNGTLAQKQTGGGTLAIATISGSLTARTDMPVFDATLNFSAVVPGFISLLPSMTGWAIAYPASKSLLIVATPANGTPLLLYVKSTN
jgi:hypothetical protein